MHTLVNNLKNLSKKSTFVFFMAFLGGFIIVSGILFSLLRQNNLKLHEASLRETKLKMQLQKVGTDLHALQTEDQVVINKNLTDEVKHIHDGYTEASKTYEKLVDFKLQAKDTTKLDADFAKALHLLSEKNYASSSAIIADVNKTIDDETAKSQAQFVSQNTVSAPQSNNPPAAGGYSRQQVQSDVGTFLVDIISADLGSTRVIVDTASDNDCHDNCPTLPLASYAARSGAYAGINGNYFCPAEYPSCAGKTNSFDLLVMNKNKHYFNSDNNVYSNNPAVIFGGGFVRFVGAASQWGRDTGVDGVLSNYPLLVSGNNVSYDSSSDPKFNSKGPRCFVANKGNTVYIGCVSNATMRDSAHVLKSLGMDNAMNLDEGGSTALWYGGYKLGPGRNLPSAILFVRK